MIIMINEIIFAKHLAQRLKHSLQVFSICFLLFYFKIII